MWEVSIFKLPFTLTPVGSGGSNVIINGCSVACVAKKWTSTKKKKKERRKEEKRSALA
jgi:hypothetical protein